MKTYEVKARDIGDAWFQLVDLCYQSGRDYKVGEGSYADCQYRKELDYVTCHITNPTTRPLLPDIPPALGIPDPVPEGMDYIFRYLTYLMTDAKREGEQYTYGQRLFSKIQVQHGNEEPMEIESQVGEVIKKFKRGFRNNQCCMTVASPMDIHLTDPPCLRQIDCRIYEKTEGKLDEGKLHFCIYFRSWDLWCGFPANLAAIVHLQEYMADGIGVETGEFICASKGLHLYSQYWDLAKKRLGESND